MYVHEARGFTYHTDRLLSACAYSSGRKNAPNKGYALNKRMVQEIIMICKRHIKCVLIQALFLLAYSHYFTSGKWLGHPFMHLIEGANP